MKDIRPYVCTFEDCPTGAKSRLFDSYHSWISHEQQYHRREWCCSLCDAVFDQVSSLEDHWTCDHPDQPALHPTVLTFSERPAVTLVQRCILCGLEAAPQMLARHLRNHMEELALFVTHGWWEVSEPETAGNNSNENQGKRSCTSGANSRSSARIESWSAGKLSPSQSGWETFLREPENEDVGRRYREIDIRHVAEKLEAHGRTGQGILARRLAYGNTKRRALLHFYRTHAGNFSETAGGMMNVTVRDINHPEGSDSGNDNSQAICQSEGSVKEILVPLPPSQALPLGTSTFVCPVCKNVINPQSERDWRYVPHPLEI